MRRSRPRRSTDRSRRDLAPGRRRGVDVYLLPAVVGSGRGDVEEVLLVGRALAGAGYTVRVVRPPERPLALLEDRHYDWTGIRRARHLRPRADRAVTVSPQFGVTAADRRDEPLGRAGPWATERAEIDRAYGPERVLHVSLEEFGRGRPARELTEERWREAGQLGPARRRWRRTGGRRHETAEFAALYRKFRAMDVANLLLLYPTFRPSGGFAREFPESVQSGPLWPATPVPRGRRSASPAIRVLWYASASTSDRLGPRLIAGLDRVGSRGELTVRSPQRLALRRSGRVRLRAIPLRPRSRWRDEWSRADLAIVTGTRSLLEAIVARVPFLYFNGVMGRGRSARRHRPEKIDALLRVLRASGASPRLWRDLSDFARLRRVEAIVADAASRPARYRLPAPSALVLGFPPGFESGVGLIRETVERFARQDRTASALVADIRRESRRRRRDGARAVSKV